MVRDRIRWNAKAAVVAVLMGVCGASCAPAGGAPQESGNRSFDPQRADTVRLTWLSVTNWLLEAGDTRILLDAYLTRVDRRTVEADGTSSAPASTDRALLARIVDAVIPDRRLDWIFVGHGHWDHAFDAPALADLSGARIGGARTICHQAAAIGLPRDRCLPLEGGEVLDVGPGVRVRAVRWHHSGDSTGNGRRLRAPLELKGPPAIDSATKGLRPGFLEDYPNGGGARGYLITVRSSGRALTVFWTNTGNPEAWDAPVPEDWDFLRASGVDTSNLEWAGSNQPTREALAAALELEGLDAVDLWIGFPGTLHVRQVSALLHPRTFIPQHWDDFWEPLFEGVRTPFAPATTDALAALGSRVVVPANYFDRFQLDASGVTARGDEGIRAKLGIGVVR